MRKCDLPLHSNELTTTLNGYLYWRSDDPTHAFKGNEYLQKRVVIPMPLVDTVVEVWRQRLASDDQSGQQALTHIASRPANIVTLLLLLALPADLGSQLIKLESDNMQLCYQRFHYQNNGQTTVGDEIDDHLQKLLVNAQQQDHIDQQLLLLLSAIVLQNSGGKDADGDYYGMDGLVNDNTHKYDVLKQAQQKLLHNLDEQQQRYQLKAHQATLRKGINE